MSNNLGLLQGWVTAGHVWLAEFNPRRDGGFLKGMNIEYLGQTCEHQFWPLKPGHFYLSL